MLTPEVLHGFSAGIPSFHTGAVPGNDGNFYGVSERGGKGEGTVFRVTPAGVATILVEFGDEQSEARGRQPVGPLLHDGAGTFYGVTRGGGRFTNGTIFRVTAAGVIQTLVDFSGEDGAAPGANPDASLTLGADGNFYGTTRNGGVRDADGEDYGSVFRLSPQGRYEEFAGFTGIGGALPGHNPDARMVLLPDGSLAGTTERGGKFDRGTIFVINTVGQSLRSIAFAPTTTATTLEGREPFGDLVCTADGTIYGLLGGGGSDTQIWLLATSGPSLFVDLDNDSLGNPIFGIEAGLGLTSGGDLLFAVNTDNSGFGGLYVVTVGVGTTTRLGNFPASPGRVSYDYGGFPIAGDGAGGTLGSHYGILYRATAGGVITELARPSPDGGSMLGISPAARMTWARSSSSRRRAASACSHRCPRALDSAAMTTFAS